MMALEDGAGRPDAPNTGTDAQACYDARDLIGAGQTAAIRLDGKVYTLRITRAGKLILTK
ncbi:MAG: hemin uptake protein HemP [Roseovarius sp.]